ncbi:MAG: SDR family oxidoreductase [Bacillati bacterium ANGP1]|uniref:SDR family oxidoreductase n=1 Tax=Candidatus Segetimicrobium genomatis TaxID=2569760 RepID=A0A537JCX3_9BACT|nr:MAG: SDR family oxidoreductase [Terrabacteria group bacterium ANGP1]
MQRGWRVLVTGGAGFVGSHLCERLLADGCEVLCLDNLKTSGGENIDHLRSAPRFTFVRHDITQPVFVEGLLDCVLHFASPASPRDYLRYPIHTLKVGGPGTYHALGLAKAKQATFLLASTSEVYGDPEVNPQPEHYWGHVNPVGPRSVYDEAKRYAEAITLAYHRAHGLRVRIARVFNTYGPRMRVDDGRVLPNFMSQALRGEPLTIYGTGLQTRSLCYVSDLVEGILRLARFGAPEPLIINLGNPDEVTIGALAREVLEVTGSSSDIVYRPLPEDDPRVRRPDISLARRILGWTPAVPRREGLRSLVPYFRKALQEAESVRSRVEA